MLCFFSRMTIGTWHNMFVKTVSILCAVSYLAVFLTVSMLPIEVGFRIELIVSRLRLAVSLLRRTGSKFINRS